MKDQLRVKKEPTVHHVLAYSYAVYFLSVLIGLLFTILHPFRIFQHEAIPIFGFIFLTLGTYLIYWAQTTSRKTRSAREVPEAVSPHIFSRGPYTFSSSPTHLGLTLLSFGFALTMNSLMLVATTLAALLITKFVFVKKEEAMLAQKYGEQYEEYKKTIK